MRSRNQLDSNPASGAPSTMTVALSSSGFAVAVWTSLTAVIAIVVSLCLADSRRFV